MLSTTLLLLTLSRTRGSSIVAKFSSGERSTCPKSGPPTYSTKPPSSSLSAVSTSSSSSTDSNHMLVRRNTCHKRATCHPEKVSIPLLSALVPTRGRLWRACGSRSVGAGHHHAVVVVVKEVIRVMKFPYDTYLELINQDSDWVQFVILTLVIHTESAIEAIIVYVKLRAASQGLNVVVPLWTAVEFEGVEEVVNCNRYPASICFEVEYQSALVLAGFFAKQIQLASCCRSRLRCGSW
nr:hypothetical protein CFP56_11361 [Quercus suber]